MAREKGEWREEEGREVTTNWIQLDTHIPNNARSIPSIARLNGDYYTAHTHYTERSGRDGQRKNEKGEEEREKSRSALLP